MTASVAQTKPLTRIRWNGPSCNEILPRLYLGDYHTARNKEEITKLGITDMITVETRMLSELELAPSVKRYLHLKAMDCQKQDLISHFSTTNQFIESALEVPSNKVYVHCGVGISRSATIVIAYLMKTRLMDYNEAFHFVRLRRTVVLPNEGFIEQLKLFRKMNYTIDLSNLEYRYRVLMSLLFEHRSNLTPQLKGNMAHLLEPYYNKLHLQQVNQFPHIYEPSKAYKCNKCRTIVFYAPSIIRVPPETSVTTPKRERSLHLTARIDSSTAASSTEKVKECPFIFIEPQPWMYNIYHCNSGYIFCYKCKRDLGRFDMGGWQHCNCSKHYDSGLNLVKIMREKVEN